MQVVDKMEKAGAGSLEVTARQRKKIVLFLVETEVKVVDSATLSGVSSGRGLDDLDSWWNVGISNGGCWLRSTQSALGASRWEGPSQAAFRRFVFRDVMTWTEAFPQVLAPLGLSQCTGWVQATGWWQVIGLCFVYVRVFVDFRRAVCWSRNLALLWFVMSICLWRELQAAKLGSKSNCSLFAHVAIKVHSPSCTCQHGCQPRTGKLANVSLSDCTGGLHFWIIKVPMLPFLWQSWPFVSHLMRSWEAGVAHVPECLSAGPTLPKNQWTLNKSLWDGFCLELMFSWYQWEWFEMATSTTIVPCCDLTAGHFWNTKELCWADPVVTSANAAESLQKNFLAAARFAERLHVFAGLNWR